MSKLLFRVAHTLKSILLYFVYVFCVYRFHFLEFILPTVTLRFDSKCSMWWFEGLDLNHVFCKALFLESVT